MKNCICNVETYGIGYRLGLILLPNKPNEREWWRTAGIKHCDELHMCRLNQCITKGMENMVKYTESLHIKR